MLDLAWRGLANVDEGGALGGDGLILERSVIGLLLAGDSGRFDKKARQSLDDVPFLLVVECPCTNDNSNPGVLPPCSTLYGQTYTDWSVRWWQWYPPLTVVPDGADCGNNQRGPVWFLASSFLPTVTCTVPAAKALFFPIADLECSNKDRDPGFRRNTEDARRECAKNWADGIQGLEADIDGVTVQNPTRYRFQSPEFDVTVPKGNIGGLYPDSAKSVADGYYLLLFPLSAGPHKIHVTGTFTKDGFGNPIGPVPLDTTFVLTMQ
jgi:hypothetical protein